MTDLIDALTSPNIRRRTRAIQTFDQFNGSSVNVAILTAALKCKHSDVRWHATYALTRIAKKGTARALGDCLSTDTDFVVRLKAIDALAALKTNTAVKALVQAFADDSSVVRAAAVNSLVNINNDFSSIALVHGLIDENSGVSAECAEALVEIGDRRIVTLLIGQFDNENAAARLRIASVLHDIGSRQAVAALVRALTGPDESSRQVVIDVLANRRSPQINMALARALKRQNAKHAEIMWDAIAKIGSTEEVSQLFGKFEELRRTHTIEEQRAFVAHEVKSSIGPLRMVAKKMRELLDRAKLDKPKLIEYVERIVSDTATAYQVVDQYVNYTRPVIPRFQKTNLRMLIEECLSEVRAQCDEVRIAISVVCNSDMETMVDRGLLAQAMRNILQNAIDAIGTNGQIIITLRNPRNRVTIRITDSGSGIDPKNLDRVFDLGFTTKQGSHGAGVGLALVRRIIEEGHNGNIDVANNKGGNGVTVTVVLPRPPLPETLRKGRRHETKKVAAADRR